MPDAAKSKRLKPEARRHRAAPAAIGVLSTLAAAAALDKRGFASVSIISRWADIVGNELAAHAVPVEVKFPRGRNDRATLVLQVASGAAATLLQMKAPVLLERVNGFLGYGAIGRLEAHQGPLPKPRRRPVNAIVTLSPEDEARVDQKIKNIVSPDVKSALQRLGLSLARRQAADDKRSGN